MVRWGYLGGRVLNHSSKRLVVAYDHPRLDDTWAHSYLGPGEDTPRSQDIDGFRADDKDVGVIYSPLIAADELHFSWWKIANGMTAVVTDEGSNKVKFKVITDGGFGKLTQFTSP